MQRRVEERRLHIIGAAAQLLADKGLDALTAEAVAAKADVAMQTVYNRVGGRQALLAEITELAIKENQRHVDVAYASDGTPAQRLERAALAYAAFALESPHLFLLLASPPDEEVAAAKLKGQVQTQNAKAIQAYQEGMTAGLFRTDLLAEDAIFVLWAMLNGLLTTAVREGPLQPSEAQRARLLMAVTSILRQGIAAPGL
jgi:AcrR family transcriptional regulator